MYLYYFFIFGELVLFFFEDDEGSITIRLIRRGSVDFLLFLSLDDDDESIINFLLVLDILKVYYIYYIFI